MGPRAKNDLETERSKEYIAIFFGVSLCALVFGYGVYTVYLSHQEFTVEFKVFEEIIKPILSEFQIEVYGVYTSPELAVEEEKQFGSVTLSLTNGELAQMMGKYPNETSGRVLELRRLGLLRLKERRKCRASHNNAWAVEVWR